jgi:hypothetical protein
MHPDCHLTALAARGFRASSLADAQAQPLVRNGHRAAVWHGHRHQTEEIHDPAVQLVRAKQLGQSLG